MPLPDGSTEQPLAAVSQAPESRYSGSKSPTGAAARLKETTSGETTVQRPKPLTIESSSLFPKATHDTKQQSSDPCGILKQHNGMFTVHNIRRVI